MSDKDPKFKANDKDPELNSALTQLQSIAERICVIQDQLNSSNIHSLHTLIEARLSEIETRLCEGIRSGLAQVLAQITDIKDRVHDPYTTGHILRPGVHFSHNMPLVTCENRSDGHTDLHVPVSSPSIPGQTQVVATCNSVPRADLELSEDAVTASSSTKMATKANIPRSASGVATGPTGAHSAAPAIRLAIHGRDRALPAVSDLTSSSGLVASAGPPLSRLLPLPGAAAAAAVAVNFPDQSSVERAGGAAQNSVRTSASCAPVPDVPEAASVPLTPQRTKSAPVPAVGPAIAQSSIDSRPPASETHGAATCHLPYSPGCPDGEGRQPPTRSEFPSPPEPNPASPHHGPKPLRRGVTFGLLLPAGTGALGGRGGGPGPRRASVAYHPWAGRVAGPQPAGNGLGESHGADQDPAEAATDMAGLSEGGGGAEARRYSARRASAALAVSEALAQLGGGSAGGARREFVGRTPSAVAAAAAALGLLDGGDDDAAAARQRLSVRRASAFTRASSAPASVGSGGGDLASDADLVDAAEEDDGAGEQVLAMRARMHRSVCASILRPPSSLL